MRRKLHIEKTENKIYDNEGNSALLNLIPADSKIILDVGCGSGSNARRLKELGKIVDGITLSPDEAKQAEQYCRSVFVFDLENGLPKEISSGYDLILCSHVLEHIAYPEKLLKDIHRMLSNNASILMIALPNFMNYKNRIGMLFGRFEYEKDGNMDYTHLRWYTYKSGKRLLARNNFVIISSNVEVTLPWKSFLSFLPSAIQNILVSILKGVSKGLFGSQFILVAKPKK